MRKRGTFLANKVRQLVCVVVLAAEEKTLAADLRGGWSLQCLDKRAGNVADVDPRERRKGGVGLEESIEQAFRTDCVGREGITLEWATVTRSEGPVKEAGAHYRAISIASRG